MFSHPCRRNGTVSHDQVPVWLYEGARSCLIENHHLTDYLLRFVESIDGAKTVDAYVREAAVCELSALNERAIN